MQSRKMNWACLAIMLAVATGCGPQGGASSEATADNPDSLAAAVLGEVRHLLGDSAVGKRYILKIEDDGDTFVWRGRITH